MSSTEGKTAASDPGLFQCGSCKRHYKRLDHLARHVRSHTQSRPYQCHLCPKAFARTDLLKRHVAGHDTQGDRIDQLRSWSTQEQSTSRVAQACRACASNHLRCTDDKPCRRCTEKGIECAWNQSLDLAFTPPATDRQQSVPGDNVTQQQQDELSPPSDTVMMQQPPTSADESFSAFPGLNLLSGQLLFSMGVPDMDMDPNIELDDIDLRFLDAYNASVPFEFGSGSVRGTVGEQVPESPSDPCRPAAICTEAFRNSHWRFQPNIHDHSGAEDHNLSLPANPNDNRSPESLVSLDRRTTNAPLGTAARDRILTTVVKSCRPENLSRAVASFPSLELLDSLIQYYLTSSVARASFFLHTATFDPNEKRPELLAAMAAHGAVLTLDPTLTKLGLAIQECVRLAVPKHWEEDNTLVRDLELVQAFLITLEIGLWSGRSRKVEISESFLQPLLTMLRRGGKFRRSAYPEILPSDDMDGDSLHGTWQLWIQQESFKRLAFRIHQHDTSASMALLVNPLISYAELQLPLPVSADLWSASSAEQWRPMILSQANFRAPTVADYFDDPEAFATNRTTVDTLASSLAFLSSAWTLSWEYIQLSSLQRARPRRWNALIMTSRQEELLKLLNHFQISMDPRMPYAHDVMMRLEHIQLHLHMSFEDIQIFAGMDGPEQARTVYPMILEWVRSEAARKAVWHAGQIIRAAKLLPKATIQGPAAIMLYHASLAFWVYGLLSESPTSLSEGISNRWGNAHTAAAAHPQDVWLDGQECLSLQRFTQFGSGRPCIRSMSQSDDRHIVPGSAYLSQPDRVMDTVVAVLRANFDGMSRPHLVDRLIQLMVALQKSAGGTGDS